MGTNLEKLLKAAQAAGLDPKLVDAARAEVKSATKPDHSAMFTQLNDFLMADIMASMETADPAADLRRKSAELNDGKPVGPYPASRREWTAKHWAQHVAANAKWTDA